VKSNPTSSSDSGRERYSPTRRDSSSSSSTRAQCSRKSRRFSSPGKIFHKIMTDYHLVTVSPSKSLLDRTCERNLVSSSPSVRSNAQGDALMSRTDAASAPPAKPVRLAHIKVLRHRARAGASRVRRPRPVIRPPTLTMSRLRRGAVVRRAGAACPLSRRAALAWRPLPRMKSGYPLCCHRCRARESRLTLRLGES
jgi:hypothetical protein